MPRPVAPAGLGTVLALERDGTGQEYVGVDAAMADGAE